MAYNDRLKEIISKVQLLRELADSMIDAEMYPVSFFSRAYDLIQKLQNDFHTMEAEQVEIFAEQLKNHQALILSIHQQMRQFSTQTQSDTPVVAKQEQPVNLPEPVFPLTANELPVQPTPTPSPSQSQSPSPSPDQQVQPSVQPEFTLNLSEQTLLQPEFTLNLSEQSLLQPEPTLNLSEQTLLQPELIREGDFSTAETVAIQIQSSPADIIQAGNIPNEEKPEAPEARPARPVAAGGSATPPPVRPIPPEMPEARPARPVAAGGSATPPPVRPIPPEAPVARPARPVPDGATGTQSQDPAYIGIPSFLSSIGADIPAEHNNSVNQSFNHSPLDEPTINDVIEKQKVSDLRKAFSLNDRFRYRKELFNGSEEAMNKVIEILNDRPSLDESIRFLEQKLHWDLNDPTVKDFIKVLGLRF